jgi:hypothetical protein
MVPSCYQGKFTFLSQHKILDFCSTHNELFQEKYHLTEEPFFTFFFTKTDFRKKA